MDLCSRSKFNNKITQFLDVCIDYKILFLEIVVSNVKYLLHFPTDLILIVGFLLAGCQVVK